MIDEDTRRALKRRVDLMTLITAVGWAIFVVAVLLACSVAECGNARAGQPEPSERFSGAAGGPVGGVVAPLGTPPAPSLVPPVIAWPQSRELPAPFPVSDGKLNGGWKSQPAGDSSARVAGTQRGLLPSVKGGDWCSAGVFPAPAEPVTWHPEPGVPHEVEAKLVERADADCVNRYGTRQARPGALDPWAALSLLRLEQRRGVSVDAQGILLAAWCREASYQLEPADGDGGLAVGPLQLHPVFERRCADGGGPRKSAGGRQDLSWAAACYLARVAAKLDAVASRCGSRDWLVAEAWTASWPRYGRLCRMSQHGEILNRWQRGL